MLLPAIKVQMFFEDRDRESYVIESVLSGGTYISALLVFTYNDWVILETTDKDES